MELGPATLVLGNGSSAAPVLGMEKDELIQVAWPDLSSLDHDAAIRVLGDAYAKAFSSATTKWVILEPIDRARFGAHSQHDLTARAVLREKSDKYVALCVFAELDEAASYDAAFSAALSRGP
jgi:hypothetical protein